MSAPAPAVAVHEAGHAVVAFALGYRVGCVSRVRSNVHRCVGGHVRVADWHELRRWPCDRALIAAGGAALADIAGLPDSEAGCLGDRLLVDACEEQWQERVGAARVLLLDGWELAAARVVWALRRRPVLDGADFHAVVTGLRAAS